MFNISKLILNSLYKFLCLVGLLSSVFFIAVPEFLEFSWRTKQIESLNIKAEHIKSMQEFLNASENHHQELEILTTMLGTDWVSSNPKEKKEIIMMVIESNRKLSSAYQSEDYRSFLSDIKNIEATYYKDKLKYISELRFWGLVISIGVLVIGLIGWYFQVQKPLDVAFKKDPSKFVESNV
ncbi:hypothetical protein ABRZ67_22730 [Vibrio vulnificus]|uniref:hypothetical protein n=1 Tax=Vibrio vulnificus TaxID=672 RepID=UPI002FBDAC5E